MKYKLNRTSKQVEIVYAVWELILFLFIDMSIIIFVDFMLVIPFTDLIYSLVETIDDTIELTTENIYTIYKSVLVIEFLIVLAINIKRRFLYCQMRYKGVYIYNNNFTKFGYGKFYKLNATIPYSEIETCYKARAVDCPPTYRYQYYYLFTYLSKKINKDTSYGYIPPILYGDYDSECVILQLHNKKIVPLPIEDCDGFIEEFERWCSITNNAKK